MALFLPSSRRFIWVILCIAGAINSMWVLMMQSGSMLASWTASLTWRSRPLNLVLRTENLDPPSTPVARCWGGRPCCWCPGWPWSCVSWSWCGPLTSALVPCIIPHPPRWHSGWKQPYNKKKHCILFTVGGSGGQSDSGWSSWLPWAECLRHPNSKFLGLSLSSALRNCKSCFIFKCFNYDISNFIL